ncbi:hypothetical protein SAY86_014032 [Trapa natans]|uniref:Pentatricopeptide repeat-containing protein n=1 Tax=Trapa natans TaxID=22666 RepID=A0AAN7KS03_TRANT|nr:hypothetical protein SAY86_014032 [Trapa natans]
MPNPVGLQSILRTLRTAKKGLHPLRFVPFLCQETLDLISQPPSAASSSPSLTHFFSDLDLSSLHGILSDHYIPSSTCLKLFNFLLTHHSSISFEPDLLSHLIVACRLLKATKFSEAKKVIKFVTVDQMLRYPFPLIADEFHGCPCKPRTAAKFFNTMLQVYSENCLYDEALMAFNHMKAKGIQVNERTCTVHILALGKCAEVERCVEFFHRMLKTGTPVSVYSLTAVVEGLCRSGEIKMGRELVEEMVRRGAVRPNVVTFNVLIAACAKRWNFEELALVSGLMEKEAVGFNIRTYRLLLDGFTSSRKVEEAKKLLTEMHGKGLKVDANSYNLVINACGVSGAMGSAISVFDEMTERGVVKNADTYWALADGLHRVGDMGAVDGYMDEMRRRGMADAVQKVRLLMKSKGYNSSWGILGRERKARRRPNKLGPRDGGMNMSNTNTALKHRAWPN